MIKNLSVYDMRDAFNKMGRGDSFTYEGYKALYNFLEEFNPEYELDVIGLDCEFAEDEPEYFLEQYGLESIDELRDNTIVLEIEGRTTIIIQSY